MRYIDKNESTEYTLEYREVLKNGNWGSWKDGSGFNNMNGVYHDPVAVRTQKTRLSGRMEDRGVVHEFRVLSRQVTRTAWKVVPFDD